MSLDSEFANRARALLAQRNPEASDLQRLRMHAGDPVRFAADVLGLALWQRQCDLVRAALVDTYVACVSGQKTGKTTALAVLALWFYCCFPESRVFIMAPTLAQLN